MKTVLAWLIVFSLILLMLLSGCVKIVPVYEPFNPSHVTTYVCKPGKPCVEVKKEQCNVYPCTDIDVINRP